MPKRSVPKRSVPKRSVPKWSVPKRSGCFARLAHFYTRIENLLAEKVGVSSACRLVLIEFTV